MMEVQGRINTEGTADTTGRLDNFLAAMPARRADIKDFKYPEGIRLAVTFTVDFDAMLARKLMQDLARKAHLDCWIPPDDPAAWLDEIGSELQERFDVLAYLDHKAATKRVKQIKNSLDEVLAKHTSVTREKPRSSTPTVDPRQLKIPTIGK